MFRFMLDISNSSFVQFQIWDFPGDIDFDDSSADSDAIFKGTGALIFVIDAQEDNYTEALAKLHRTIVRGFLVNPKIKFEVFIHKVDTLSDDQKMEAQREIHDHVINDLRDSRMEQVNMSFHFTSIYDQSIFEAFSKVVQKLIPQLPTLENLLDILNSNCRMDKAFLIDVASKIYVATDSSPVDMQTLELCSDMIDVVINISCIYGNREDGDSMASVGYDPETQSVIKLNNGMVLYMREVNRFLALVCLLRQDKFDKHGLIDYNFQCFKKAINQVFEVSQRAHKGKSVAQKH
jgi:Ras-related GTP-binding protein C/D